MTTQEWKKKLTDEWLKQPGIEEVYGIDPNKSFDEQFSAVSIENLLFYAQAFGLMVLVSIMYLLPFESVTILWHVDIESLKVNLFKASPPFCIDCFIRKYKSHHLF